MQAEEERKKEKKRRLWWTLSSVTAHASRSDQCTAHIADDFFFNLFYNPVCSFWQFNCIIFWAEYLVSCALISVVYEEPLVLSWTWVPHSRKRAL